MTVSEDRMFDLMVDLVEFASARGLPRTALALEDALDAFLQDRGLAPQALPPPRPSAPPPGPEARAVAVAAAVAALAPPAVRGPVGAAAAVPAITVPPAVQAAIRAPDAARAAPGAGLFRTGVARAAWHDGADPASARPGSAADSTGAAVFHTVRGGGTRHADSPAALPRRLHLLPSQRVTG